jgi:hypothetical protein
MVAVTHVPLPWILVTPSSHRSALTGTKLTGRLTVGALAGQPTQSTWPAGTVPPLIVGTSVGAARGGEPISVPPGVGSPDAPAGLDPAGAGDAEPPAPADAWPLDAGLAGVPAVAAGELAVPHPAASARTAATAERRAGDPVGVIMSVPRF